VCSNKADIHEVNSEFKDNNQSEMISHNVEYIVLITNIIDRVK